MQTQGRPFGRAVILLNMQYQMSHYDRLRHALKDWAYTAHGMVIVVIVWTVLVLALLMGVVAFWGL